MPLVDVLRAWWDSEAPYYVVYDVPAAAYYPSDSLNNDGSNFFGPNPAAVEGMLLDAGFSRVTRFAPWSTNTWYSIDPPNGAATGVLDKARRRWRQRRSGGRANSFQRP